MGINVISNLSNKPVNDPSNLKDHLQAKGKIKRIRVEDFKEEFSSVTGVLSNTMYIAKLSKFDCEPERPDIFIISSTSFHIDATKTKSITGRPGEASYKNRSFIPILSEKDKDDQEPFFEIEDNRKPVN